VQLLFEKQNFNAVFSFWRRDGLADGAECANASRGYDSSTLLHHGRSPPELALDLLASPAGRLNGPRLEFAVGSRLLDQGSDPILTEGLNQLSVRICVGEITGKKIGVSNEYG